MPWTIGGVKMSPEAHYAAAATLLERAGAKPEHVVAVLHAWRTTAPHLWHTVNVLRAARWWAPSAAAADAIGGLIVALEAMGSLEFGAPADDLDRLALACDTSTDDGYRRYMRLAVAADARRREHTVVSPAALAGRPAAGRGARDADANTWDM